MKETTEVKEAVGVKFFGKIDINRKGAIASEIPAWSMTAQLDDLREGLARKKRSIERGEIPLDGIPQLREEIRVEEEKLIKIEDSRPHLNDTQENEVNRVRKSIAKKISPTMFTRTEMRQGLADPQDEAKKMVQPIIKLDKGEIAMCEANEIPVSKDGMVSRNQASKLYKLTQRYFGESGNIEYLRKDKVRG